MNPVRLAILGVALVAGVGAFFLMMGRDSEQAPVQIVQAKKEETVRVLVVTRDIQRGERIALEDTNWIVWPKKAVQPAFVTDADPAGREAITGSVARSMLVSGEPIVNAKIVKEDGAGLMASLLSPGMRAVTLRVSPETSSGGFILPGDRVDLLHTANRRTRVVFEDVRVLAVNTVLSENLQTPHIAGSNMTLEFTPEDAKAFIKRNAAGNFSVVLRSIFTPEGEAVANKRNTSDVNVIRYGRS